MDKELVAFIPAAGIGRRLRPLTYFYPKPCLPVKGKPLIEYAIEQCLPICEPIFISTYYKENNLRKCLESRPYLKRLTFWSDKNNDNIGGSLIRHQKTVFSSSIIAEHVLVIPSDHVLKNFPLKDIFKYHKAKMADVTIVLVGGKNYGDRVVLSDEQRILKIFNESKVGCKEIVSTGIYLFRKSFLKNTLLKQTKASIKHDLTRETIIPSLGSASVFGYCLPDNSYWDDAGTWFRYIKNNL